MEESKKSQNKYCLSKKQRKFIGDWCQYQLDNYSLEALYMQLITRKVAHNNMIIKFINISYITKFLYIN